MTHFDDIPQLTQYGNFSVTVPFTMIESILASYGEMYNVITDPDFQRAHVWTEAQQVAYVEYLFRGGVSSREILWNCPAFNLSNRNLSKDMCLVDGKQRLEAMRKFMRNELQTQWGKREDFDKSCFRFTNGLTFTINDLPTRAMMLQWYLEINSGGVVHTEDELQLVRDLLKAEKEKNEAH
jgi:hypothetical protein